MFGIGLTCLKPLIEYHNETSLFTIVFTSPIGK